MVLSEWNTLLERRQNKADETLIGSHHEPLRAKRRHGPDISGWYAGYLDSASPDPIRLEAAAGNCAPRWCAICPRAFHPLGMDLLISPLS